MMKDYYGNWIDDMAKRILIGNPKFFDPFNGIPAKPFVDSRLIFIVRHDTIEVHAPGVIKNNPKKVRSSAKVTLHDGDEWNLRYGMMLAFAKLFCKYYDYRNTYTTLLYLDPNIFKGGLEYWKKFDPVIKGMIPEMYHENMLLSTMPITNCDHRPEDDEILIYEYKDNKWDRRYKLPKNKDTDIQYSKITLSGPLRTGIPITNCEWDYDAIYKSHSFCCHECGFKFLEICRDGEKITNKAKNLKKRIDAGRNEVFECTCPKCHKPISFTVQYFF